MVTFAADEVPDFDVAPRNPHGQRSVYGPVIDRMTVIRLFRTRAPGAA